GGLHQVVEAHVVEGAEQAAELVEAAGQGGQRVELRGQVLHRLGHRLSAGGDRLLHGGGDGADGAADGGPQDAGARLRGGARSSLDRRGRGRDGRVKGVLQVLDGGQQGADVLRAQRIEGQLAERGELGGGVVGLGLRTGGVVGRGTGAVDGRGRVGSQRSAQRVVGEVDRRVLDALAVVAGPERRGQVLVDADPGEQVRGQPGDRGGDLAQRTQQRAQRVLELRRKIR